MVGEPRTARSNSADEALAGSRSEPVRPPGRAGGGRTETPSRALNGTPVALDAVALALRQRVIPMLVRQHNGKAAVEPVPMLRKGYQRPVPTPPPIAVASVTELARLVVVGDELNAERVVDRLRLVGLPVDAISRHLLEPAARELGVLWCSDDLDFSQVTIGVWHLQRLVRRLDVTADALVAPRDDYRALLVPTPGEQHGFGIFSVAACFRRAGWIVSGGTSMSVPDVLRLVRDDWFAVVGLSLGAERGLDELRTAIRQIRRASRNRQIGVMVGGAAFIGHPERVHAVGADTTAQDGPAAVAKAGRFVERMSST